MDDPALARRLAEARTQRLETQEEAAKNMGISASTLSILERRGNLGAARFTDVLAVTRYYGWPLEEVMALYSDTAETAEGLPPDISLLLRGLPAEKKALVFQVIGALVRGLGE